MTDKQLIDFVKYLYEINSDLHGYSTDNDMDRCKRWMDAVLPDRQEEILRKVREFNGP